MKNLLSICLALVSFVSFAQVGVGTITPRASLEISNSGQGGVLIPQFALTGNGC